MAFIATMCLKLALVLLCAVAVLGDNSQLDDMYTHYGDDAAIEAFIHFLGLDDWLFELSDASVCDPNPCFNGASCQTVSSTEFKCTCVEPYTGKLCQKVRNVCETVDCGHGDCVVTVKKSPFYECKCMAPYSGANCRTLPLSACEPNPCQNGGSCIKGQRRFRCACPDGYSGRFCEIAPTDCYEGNGKTYMGVSSMTEEGVECLNWNSHSVYGQNEDPFVGNQDSDGLEHNHCRNPDEDVKPWCFIKKGRNVTWSYCRVRKCSEETTAAPEPEPDSAQFSQCGKPEAVRINRIFGGKRSVPGAHPWQVSVQVRPKDSSFLFQHSCGGILIKSCWVLTAAHCISPTLEYQVVLGGVDLTKDETMDQTIPVEEAIAHENYRRTPNALYNDVALLKLQVTNSPYCAKETRFVKTACLPDSALPAGKECVTSGYGKTEHGASSSQLLNARVLLISMAKCKQPHIYGDVLDDSMLCAGILSGGTDSCEGDSGGPLVCSLDGTRYVAGVVSWGVGCGAKDKPGVYADVYHFNDWIKSKLN